MQFLAQWSWSLSLTRLSSYLRMLSRVCNLSHLFHLTFGRIMRLCKRGELYAQFSLSADKNCTLISMVILRCVARISPILGVIPLFILFRLAGPSHILLSIDSVFSFATSRRLPSLHQSCSMVLFRSRGSKWQVIYPLFETMKANQHSERSEPPHAQLQSEDVTVA